MGCQCDWFVFWNVVAHHSCNQRIVVIGVGFELATVSDDKRELVRNVVQVCQVFNASDGCFGQRHFVNAVTGDDFARCKMKKLMAACRATGGVQMSAVKSAGCNSVGWIGLVVGLNEAAKRMLEVDVAVQRKARDDCTW